MISSVLLDIKHPIEGIAYLIYIGALIRWRWPDLWNKVLDAIKAPIKQKS